MITDTAEKIIAYIGKEKQVMPNELVQYLGISRQAVFKQLKKLRKEERIEKNGEAPKTFYYIRHNMTIADIKKRTLPVLKKHGANFVGVFGSYARNEATKKSDVDLLVDFTEQKSLMDLVGIEQELSNALRVKVDMILKKSLNNRIKPYVMEDLKIIYEKR